MSPHGELDPVLLDVGWVSWETIADTLLLRDQAVDEALMAVVVVTDDMLIDLIKTAQVRHLEFSMGWVGVCE